MKRYILGEPVQGFSHIHGNVECQDSCKQVELEDGAIVLSVADGHGSKSCPFSKNGSEIAVNVFCEKIAGVYSGYQSDPERLPSFLNHEGSLKFAQDVEREWKASVLEAHLAMKREIPLTTDGQEDSGALYRMYGTTLLGLLIAPAFVFAFQLGDGDITYVDALGAQPVVAADKLLGVESHSLCSADAWKKAVSSVHLRSWDQVLPCVFMLSTDGFSNSFVNDEEFGKTCSQYFGMLNEYGAAAVKENLKSWLAETSRLGCGDDTTLLMAYFTDDMPEELHETECRSTEMIPGEPCTEDIEGAETVEWADKESVSEITEKLPEVEA